MHLISSLARSEQGPLVESLTCVQAESKLALVLASRWVDAELCADGTLQPPVFSALDLPLWRVAVLQSAPGPSPEDCDIEISDLKPKSAAHGNFDASVLTPAQVAAVALMTPAPTLRRGAWNRSTNRIDVSGGSSADHSQDRVVRAQALQQNRALVLAHAWAAVNMRGGYWAWRRLNAGLQAAAVARGLGGPPPAALGGRGRGGGGQGRGQG